MLQIEAVPSWKYEFRRVCIEHGKGPLIEMDMNSAELQVWMWTIERSAVRRGFEK